MKSRVLTSVLVMALAPSLWAVLPPKNKSFPNYDIRKELGTGMAPAAGKQAESSNVSGLRARVPNLQFNRDPLLNTARHIGVRAGYLTGPQGQGGAISSEALNAIPAGDPHRIVKAFLNENAQALGHDASALQSAAIQRNSIHARNGLRTVVWQQMKSGIPVYQARLVSHTTTEGELVSLSDTFVADASAVSSALINNPPITPESAVRIAAISSGISLDRGALSQLESPSGTSKRQAFASSQLFGKTHAELTWFPLNQSSMRLAWQVIVGARSPMSRYLVLVDAESGEMLLRRDLAVHAQKMFNVYDKDSPSPFSPGWPEASTNQPPFVDRVVVTVDTAMDTNASPMGWVYPGSGRNVNLTRGNNVSAFTDHDFDGLPDGTFYPTGGPGPDLNYNFPLDLTGNPLIHTNASAVQLFWRANWFHDLAYQLGFTEENGNYQVTNFNRGGFGNDPINMLAQAGYDYGITDNAVFFTSPDGYEGYCAMFLWSFTTPYRDGALDSEIVIHELTHGLTDRMLGGGGGIYELQTGGLGEGWSDFYALAMLSETNDDPHAVYATGGYATYNLAGLLENYYYGIRRYPYSTDMSKNPLTFKDIDPTQASAHRGIPTSPIMGGGPADEVHNMGEVWCMMLWEMRANIIDDLGHERGNQLALELVTDGLLLAPPNANFVEARDGILLADRINTGGAFYDQIWKAFAKRGLGFYAQAPASSTATGVVESFDVPLDVATGPEDGRLEVKINPPSGTVLFMVETNAMFVRVSDTKIINNATVNATLLSTNLTFSNDGSAPDVFAGDGTYSGNFVTPTNVSSVTIPVVVDASEKTPTTNVIVYPLIPAPPNDNFVNSFKLAASGGSVFTSNKRATLENNEPLHAGIQEEGASLWYNYSPPVSGDVLVDTTGSEITTVVAVYTNSALRDLGLVASALGNPGQKGAYLTFKGAAGVVYRIAVASADARKVGTIRLRVGQGIVPDTLAPFATIDFPQNGFAVSTNRVTLRGVAIDPDPDPTGIREINITISSGIGEMTTKTIYPMRSFGGPPNTNWTATIGLRAGVNKLVLTAVDYAGNRSTPVPLQITYRAIEPANDFFATAAVITNESGVLSANTLTASKELGEPNHAGLAGGKSAWWKFTPTEDGILNVSTVDSTFDTVMAVYTGDTLGSLTQLNANDDAYPYSPGGYSEISQPVTAGQTYRIAVDGYDAAGGAMFLTYNFTTGAVYQVSVTTVGKGSVTPASVSVPSGTSVTLSAVPAAGNQFSMWSGSVRSVQNPVTFTVTENMNVVAEFIPAVIVVDDFETGALNKLPWVSSGDAPWFVEAGTTNPAGGVYAARSGVIGNNQSSSLKFTGDFRTDEGSFELRVSSEPVWDRLAFYIDGKLIQQWSGELTWRSFAFPISGGTHTLEWVYSKDSGGGVGMDAIFIDNLRLPFGAPIDGSTPGKLSLLWQSNGEYYIELLGQLNQTYTLQMSMDLAEWQDLSTQTATTGILRFYDPDAAGCSGPRYYRAVVR